MGEKLVLKLDSIVKTFPGVKALDGVHLEIYEGEVHALCGENGAGKSTLMKIIAGAQGYTSGRMELDGKDVVFRSTKEAEQHGIAMIYQEFNMVPELSVAENMYLGRLPKNGAGGVNWPKLYKDARETLDHLGPVSYTHLVSSFFADCTFSHDSHLLKSYLDSRYQNPQHIV